MSRLQQCPVCGEPAQHGVYKNDSTEMPSGGPIRVCNPTDNWAYIHVLKSDTETPEKRSEVTGVIGFLKKVGAAIGSALMVGMTMGSA